MKQTVTIVVNRSTIISEYIKLMKPELTILSVITAVGGTYLALHGLPHYYLLIHTFVGTGFVGSAAGVLNQYIERNCDVLMKRTKNRPLPSGRIQPIDALSFGIVLAISGFAYLSLFANIMAVLLSVLTLVIYLIIYTPLKRQSPFATVVGGISGALPPLIGWAVVYNSISIEAWSLFFILFFWQMPHFLALGWMYREDYSRAGYKLLTTYDFSGIVTARQIIIYCCALIPASLMPTLVGSLGYIYIAGAAVLSIAFLATGIIFYRERTHPSARRLFYSSILFISSLFMLLMML